MPVINSGEVWLVVHRNRAALYREQQAKALILKDESPRKKH
jgi:hypothetical protein